MDRDLTVVPPSAGAVGVGAIGAAALDVGVGAGADADAVFETAVLVEIAACTRSAESRRAYLREWRAWREFCTARGLTPRAAVAGATAAAAAVAYREWSQAQGPAPATLARRLAALSSVHARLTRRGLCAANPFSGHALARPSALPLRPHPAVDREVAERMIGCARAQPSAWAAGRDSALLAFLYWTGVRRSEAAALDMRALRAEGTQVYVTLVRKGGRPAELLLPSAAGVALGAWLRFRAVASGPLFPMGPGGERPMSGAAVGRVVARCARAAGSSATAHQFRARFITDALDEAPLQAVQAYAGHCSPATTQRYDRSTRRGDAAALAVARARATTAPEAPPSSAI